MPFDDGLGAAVVEIAGDAVGIVGVGTELASAASWPEVAGAAVAVVVVAAAAAAAVVASCIAGGRNTRRGQVRSNLMESHHVALAATGSDLS